MSTISPYISAALAILVVRSSFSGKGLRNSIPWVLACCCLSVPLILENEFCWILNPRFILSFFDYLTLLPSGKKHCCGEKKKLMAISFSFSYNSRILFSRCPNNFPFLFLPFPSRYSLILGWSFGVDILRYIVGFFPYVFQIYIFLY